MRWNRAVAVVLSSLAALSAVGVGASTQRVAAQPTAVHWVRCPPDIGGEVRCGRLARLADPLDPTLGTITIGFELHLHHDRDAAPAEPIVAQEGGPGYPSTGSRAYYLSLFAPLRAHRDVLLIDARGTGTSGAINCPGLQVGTGDYLDEVGECGRRLGAASGAYGTGLAVDDMAAVLDALGLDRVDLYGDSYGTYFAQSFAYRHGDRLRALVLDASYPVVGLDPWYRDTNATMRDAFALVCRRDPVCAARGADPVGTLARAATALDRAPVEGVARDADGERQQVRIDGVGLALLAANATYGFPIYRELVPALEAYERGDNLPLLRLGAEYLSAASNGEPADFSYGQYIAAICNDYPLLWDRFAPLGAAREHEYDAELRTLKGTTPDGFAPFSTADWIASAWGEPETCLQWPVPRHYVPAIPPGTPAPSVPTLILSGDLDSITSPAGNRLVHSQFHNSTLVPIANGVHVMGLGDSGHCASRIIVTFVATGGDAGDTSCAAHYPEVRSVPSFAARLQRGAVPDSAVAGATALTLGDVVDRWWAMTGTRGVGLRGGMFTAEGTEQVTLRLSAVRFVNDLAVSGTVVWDRHTGSVDAALTLAGRVHGRVRVRWNTWTAHARAAVVGTIAAHHVELAVAAP